MLSQSKFLDFDVLVLAFLFCNGYLVLLFVQICPQHWECENSMRIYVYPFSPERLNQMCVYCNVLHWNNPCVSGIWHMA